MNAGFHTRWWLGALAIGIVALAALGLVAGRAPGQTAVKLSPPPSADASPSSTPGLVAIASPTTDLDQYLVTPPPPTTPPARTIEVAGVEFDLPGGWYDPPDFNTLALIAAVNSL